MIEWLKNNAVSQWIIHLKYFQILKYLVMNFMFVLCIFFGFVYEEPIEGAYNIAMFIAWFIIICTPLLYSKTFQEILIEQGPSVPMFFDNALDLAIIITFVWFGSIWTGGFLLLACVLKIGAWEKIKQTIEKRENGVSDKDDQFAELCRKIKEGKT